MEAGELVRNALGGGALTTKGLPCLAVLSLLLLGPSYKTNL